MSSARILSTSKGPSTGDWEEADTRTINLEDADPTVVNVVVAWLYTGRIHYVPEVQGAPVMEVQPGTQTTVTVPSSPEDTESWSWELLVAIYIFADRYFMQRLKKKVLALLPSKPAPHDSSLLNHI